MHATDTQHSSPHATGQIARPRTQTPGFTDWLGDRHLVFDAAAGTSLEVLRFKPAFGDSPDFEAALRVRLEVVRHAQHASLAPLHSVDRGEDGVLTLSSKHTQGRRMLELVPRAHGPAFALELIRLVTPALAALHKSGEGVTHGVLSADRIVVTRDGRLVVTEHALGSAVESLRWPRAQLADVGLIFPGDESDVTLDARADLTQLGFIALSLLLGRSVAASAYPELVPMLLDEFVASATSPMLAAKMRSWLERAMQLSPRSFATAKDAIDAFGDLPDDTDVRLATPVRTAIEARHDSRFEYKPEVRFDEPKPAATVTKMPRFEPVEPLKMEVVTESTHASSFWSRHRNLIVGGLALLAAGEGVALFALPYLRSANAVVQVTVPKPESLAANAPVPPSAAAAAAASAPLTPPPAESAATRPVDVQTAQAGAVAAAAPGKGLGGITVTSSIDLQVFSEGKLIGSTASPIAIADGNRTIELVNDTLGFRLNQTVVVRNGQMTSVKVAVPNGRLSINATPWAEVVIDGTAAGETPLANLALPIGQHEIVFRHPQLGERKQTVVVKVDGLLRVTQAMQQDNR